MRGNEPFNSLSAGDTRWPRRLPERLGADAPERLTLIGDPAILDEQLTALFCSAKCPGGQILKAYDAARALRDAGRTVVGGFHAPIEKDCLDILLCGDQSIIICLARGLEGMRIPQPWRTAVDAGRLLLLSPFPPTLRRPTKQTARQRNLLAAALADDALIIHAEPGGAVADVAAALRQWGTPIRTAEAPADG